MPRNVALQVANEAHSSAASDIVRGASVFGITIAVVFAVLLVVGIALLFRRRAGAQPSSATGIEAISGRAGALLVQVDQAIASGEDEVGFAVAQFGERATAPFVATLAASRTKVTEAFRIKQLLDDHIPESAQKKREMTLQIIALCEAAQKDLEVQEREFADLRSREADAPASIASLRERIALVSTRLSSTVPRLERLRADYEAPLTVGQQATEADARAALDAATAATDAAETHLGPSGVNAVAGEIAKAEESLHRAVVLLDAVDRLAEDLAAARVALDSLVASTTADLVEAKVQRDAAPDADTGERIIEAIAEIERVLALVSTTGVRNPLVALDNLGAAVAGLDTALASARNQKERLEHARIALAGTLVSAKSQISAARSVISSGRGSADARTRISEAERQLMLAEAEADPVEALDAARRAVTHARDADALARYRG